MLKLLNFLKQLLLIIILLYVLEPIIQADDINEIIKENIFDEIKTVVTNSSEANIPNINSKSSVVIDRNSNTILFGKNENSKCKMASTTKIMTSLIIIENCKLSDTVTISKKSALTGGSRLGLKTGDTLTVNDLLYGLMLCSGNDAAVALAEYLSGTISDFCILMNNKAKKIGLKNTNFETPHGLDSANHYTTAYELALLSNFALRNPTFTKIVGTKNYSVTINGYTKKISNTNELLGNLNGVYGIKTGFTNGANRCLVTACKRNNLDIICVVLGADTKNFRTQDSIKLIEYTFKNYEPINIQELINSNFSQWQQKNKNYFTIIKGQSQQLSLKTIPLKNNIIPLKKNLLNKVKISINCTKNIYAPISTNCEIGTITVYCESNVIAKTKILFNENINKKNIFDYFILCLSLINKIDLN